MDADRAQYVAWLRHVATEAGYDPSVRGRISALAADAGVDPSAVSRAMSGDKIPQISTQRAMAHALNVEPLEMYVRSGTIAAEDVPGGEAPSRPSPSVDQAMVALANEWGVPPEKRQVLSGIFESIAREIADAARDTGE